MTKCAANFAGENISRLKELFPGNADLHAKLDGGDESAASIVFALGRELLDISLSMKEGFTFSDD